MSQITLTYDCAIGLQDPATMASRVGAVDCYNDGVLDLLEMVVVSDTTNFIPGGVQREIVLSPTILGDDLFPTDVAKKDATRGIFSQQLSLGGLVRVTAYEPVVTP